MGQRGEDVGSNSCFQARMKTLGLALLFLIILLGWTSTSFADECILIDSDAHLDDMRAVATLAPTGRVVAVITTEGIARSREGAGAMEAFLGRAGLKIPVIVGASTDPDRKYVKQADFDKGRSTAE